jgi:hypothetical protein
MFARKRQKPLWKLIVDMSPVRPSFLTLLSISLPAYLIDNLIL